jgi:Ca-activated chloride channel homolog
MAAGYDAGIDQLREACPGCLGADPAAVENRVILITDAQPNQGALSDQELLNKLEAQARDGIYTTIVGVGLDFNTDLVERISGVRGANYFSVHAPREFEERLVRDFDFMVRLATNFLSFLS